MTEMSIKKAAVINLSSRYISVAIQILFTSILARILTPDDFGVVAVITVFTTFFMMFADMGLGAAIIQNKSLSNQDINNIFSFTVYLAIALSILFSLFSIPLSHIYSNHVYISIGAILSLSLFFDTLNIVPNAILLKNKRFFSLGIRTIVISILGAVLTIILAFLDFRYYAIVYNSVFIALITFIWNVISVPLKPSIKFNTSSIKKIKDFSMFQFSFNFVNYFSRNLDNLLIGRYLGSAALGYYDKGYRLMLYPLSMLTGVINPILLPILSDFQDNKKYIFKQYMKVVKLLSLVGAFITIFCFFSAREIILIMFGKEWLSTVTVFKFLALSVWPQMITSSTGAVFQSLGYTKLLFKTGLINSLITIIAITIGILYKDISVVAMNVTIAYMLHFFIAYYVLVKYGLENNYLEFIKKMIPDFIVVLITSVALFIATLVQIDGLIFSILYKGTICLTAFTLGLFVTKQHTMVLHLVRGKKLRSGKQFDIGL